MPTIKEYEKMLRGQNYPPIAARSIARRMRAQEVAREAAARIQYEREYQAAVSELADRQREETEDRVEEAAELQFTEDYTWTDFKDPTNTMFPATNAPGPRSDWAQYDSRNQVARIWWNRPGRLGPYTNYRNVPPQVWETLKHVPSTGRYVNAVLNAFPYDYD